MLGIRTGLLFERYPGDARSPFQLRQYPHGPKENRGREDPCLETRGTHTQYSFLFHQRALISGHL
ncbi:hypothetical protein IF2G_02861 [Cordyceps javanica]|nr:hypothetical protein IF2G_02861 [Cordyceps javanica]